jgi:hypothetical protein
LFEEGKLVEARVDKLRGLANQDIMVGVGGRSNIREHQASTGIALRVVPSVDGLPHFAKLGLKGLIRRDAPAEEERVFGVIPDLTG